MSASSSDAGPGRQGTSPGRDGRSPGRDGRSPGRDGRGEPHGSGAGGGARGAAGATVVFLQNRDFFGNRLAHLPLLHALRAGRPGSELSVLSPYPTSGFFRRLELADREVVYGRRPLRLVRRLRRRAPGLLLTLRPSSDWLNLVVGLSGARRRVGYETLGGRWLYTDVVRRDPLGYRPLYFLRLLEPLGLQADTKDVFRALAARAGPPEADGGSAAAARDGAEATDAAPTDGGGRRYCLIPGGGTRRYKRWGLENYLQLCRRLVERHGGGGDLSFVFLLGPDEVSYPGRIRVTELADRCRLLMNEPVPALARAVAGCRAAVANDCGPSHVAQMMKVPYVGLYSDHDGLASRRVRQWFYPRDGAAALTGPTGEPLSTLPVGRVLEALEEVERA